MSALMFISLATRLMSHCPLFCLSARCRRVVQSACSTRVHQMARCQPLRLKSSILTSLLVLNILWAIMLDCRVEARIPNAGPQIRTWIIIDVGARAYPRATGRVQIPSRQTPNDVMNYSARLPLRRPPILFFNRLV